MFATAISFVNSVLGVFAGFNNQCVSAFWAFNKTVGSGEAYSAVGAINLWTQGGLDYVWETYDRITSGFQYADHIIWSGTKGAYTNDGYGHVAFFSHNSRPGYIWCYSQNPNMFGLIELSTSGIVGALRLKKFRPIPTGSKLYLKKTTGVVMVRTSPDGGASLNPHYPDGIAKDVDLSVYGYVVGSTPYAGRTNAWLKTISGSYVWAGNVSGEIQGLPMVV